MKQHIMAVLCLMVICVSGCAQSLPPHEEINQAVKKSLEANGFNYSSKSRITNLSLPKQDASTDTADKRLKFLGTGLDIVRGLSVNANGAIDMKAKRSEALYDLHYDKDNVEVSIKLPLIVDYNTQTMYVGTSLLNTILEVAYPQLPTAKGKLIRINFNELLQETAASSPELAKIVEENRFSPKNIDLVNNAFKAGLSKSLAKLNDTCFSDQPLTEQGRKLGAVRHIRILLTHKETVSLILDIIDDVSQALFQDGVITKTEYAVLLTLTDIKMLEGIVEKFTLAMTLDVGIGPSGLVNGMESQLNVADKEGVYQLGLNNVSLFSDYNAPRFSINPEASGIVDAKEVLDAIMAEKAKKQKGPQADDDPEDSEICDEPSPGSS